MKRTTLTIISLFGALHLGACSSSPTEPLTTKNVSHANADTCDSDPSRTGYFVRSGRSYSDSICTVEVPN